MLIVLAYEGFSSTVQLVSPSMYIDNWVMFSDLYGEYGGARVAVGLHPYKLCATSTVNNRWLNTGV